MRATGRISEINQRLVEDGWRNDAEAHDLLDLINAEFHSDPMSVQCFDERVVDRVKWCVARRKEFVKRGPIL